ncbi:MAG: hypothetical protein K8T89_11045 [Planctomycetes bacterium]|nr:hypothetical protein [Planctomycetota bacterium]
MLASIFLDFNLPNAATWFYLSLMLAIAVFLRFNRLLALRNWDLFTLFMITPGFLLLQEAHALLYTADRNNFEASVKTQLTDRGKMLLLFGYAWLIAGSGYWFARCLLDLALEKRPALTPNLNLSGLAWMASTLFICMVVVAVRRIPDVPIEQIGKGPIALIRVQEGATAVVNYQSGIPTFDVADTRFWIERSVAMGLHLAVLVGLVLIGSIHFQDTTAGMGMACLYLLMPCTAFHVSQVHHVWPAVFLVWAVFAYRRPIIAGMLLGLAAGSIFFPLLLFPLWFGFYRGRGSARFTTGFLLATAVSLSATGVVLWSHGEISRHLGIALSLADWQAWKQPLTESIWTGAHWAYRMPIFILYMAFVILTIFWPTPRNLAQVIAQTAAVVIGVQFWYADQGGVYVLWYLPLILMMIFRPNLSDRRPLLIDPETDWLSRCSRAVRSRLRRFVSKPEQPTLALK